MCHKNSTIKKKPFFLNYSSSLSLTAINKVYWYIIIQYFFCRDKKYYNISSYIISAIYNLQIVVFLF